MKTKDFNNKLTSSRLKENVGKIFGVNVKFENYSREQLEDMRNKIRTRMFQQEGQAGFNDLLTNETYQKDKAMLALLNTRIKEMLGEDIKKLKDKMIELSEAKKGVRAPKYTKKAKGANDGNLANNYPPFDKVTRGDVIAGATGKDQKGGKKKDQKTAEGVQDMEKAVKDKEGPQPKGGAGRKTGTGYDSETNVRKPPEGKVPFTSFQQGKQGDQAARLHATQVKGKLVKGKAQSAAQPKDKHGVDEAADKCNHTPKGKKCPVHGLKECGTYEGTMRQLGELSPATLSSYRHKARNDELRSAERARRDTEISQQTTNPQVKAKSAAYAAQAQATAEKRRAGQLKATSRLSNTEEGAMSNLDADRKDRAYQKRKFDPLKHVDDPTPGERAAAQDVKRSSYADRAAMLRSAERDGRLRTESNEIFRRHVRIVNESLSYLLSEDEEGKAKAITAAGDIVNDYTSWMQRVGQYQTKSMIELADAIRADFGAAEAEAFKQAVAPALSATLETLMSQREAISNAVAVLAGEATPMEPMGTEPGIEPSGPDMMNEPDMAGDEFAAADAAAGAGTPGREMRESRFQQKLAESHSIISRLAR